MSGRRLVVAGITLAVMGLSACDATDTPVLADSCAEREARDYPELEKVAREVAKDEVFRLVKTSACEETGSPYAIVYAVLKEQQSRGYGTRLLRQHGWTDDPDAGLISPNGKFLGSATTVTAADATQPEVFLSFSRRTKAPEG